jgi:hypothetical protein
MPSPVFRLRLPTGRFLLAVTVALGVVACNNESVTGTGGALAQLEMDMPDTVHSGVPFDAGASAANVGVEGVHEGVVTIALPAPLRVTEISASPGTSATFSNDGIGATVTWELHTLDSFTRSNLTIFATAALPPGAPEQILTAQASMVADGIGFGELVANDSFVLAP